MIGEHLEQFAGLAVIPWDATTTLPPEQVAWSVGVDPEKYWGQGARGPSCVDTVNELAKRPYASKIRAIVVGPWSLEGDSTADDVVTALAEHSEIFTSLTAIFLGDIVMEEQEISWILQGDVTPLLTAYPKLEVLRVRGSEGLSMSPVRHEALRELAFETGGLPKEVVRAITESKLPALEHLELWLGGEDYQRTVELADLEPFFTGGDAATYRTNTPFPKLRYLGLRNAHDTDDIAKRLATAPIVSQLRELDLSMGTISDEGAEALLGSPLVRGLKKLNLAHHYLSDAMQKRLRGLGVTVDLSEAEGESDDRYNSVSE
jgi:hypothetical protein